MLLCTVGNFCWQTILQVTAGNHVFSEKEPLEVCTFASGCSLAELLYSVRMHLLADPRGDMLMP